MKTYCERFFVLEIVSLGKIKKKNDFGFFYGPEMKDLVQFKVSESCFDFFFALERLFDVLREKVKDSVG